MWESSGRAAPGLGYPPGHHGLPPRRPPPPAPRPLLSGAAGRALVVLALVNLLNYLDRFVVSALAESLKRSALALSDTQLGLLMTGFVVVYMLASPVFGTLGDRRRPPAAGGAGRLRLEPGHRAGRVRRQLHGPLPGPRRGRHRRGGLRHHRPQPAGRPLPEDAARPRHGRLLRRHPHRLGARLRGGRPGQPRLRLARGLLHRRRPRAAARAPLPPARRPASRRAGRRAAPRPPSPGAWPPTATCSTTGATCSPSSATPPTPSPSAGWPSGCPPSWSGSAASRRPRPPSSSAPSWW